MGIIILAIIIWILYTNWKKKQGQGGNYIPPAGNQQNITQQASPSQSAQTVQCPHCGGENKSGSYFCVHCGQKI